MTFSLVIYHKLFHICHPPLEVPPPHGSAAPFRSAARSDLPPLVRHCLQNIFDQVEQEGLSKSFGGELATVSHRMSSLSSVKQAMNTSSGILRDFQAL